MNRKGFTLIEILLVVVIIGIMLAIIVPRAWRANIDTKYTLLRQNCGELSSFSMQWAEIQLLAQDEQTSTATMDNYLLSLATPDSAQTYPTGSFVATWVGFTPTSNWNKRGWATLPIDIPGRNMPVNLPKEDPETSVEGTIAPEKIPRNPFNEVSVFQLSNDPANQGTPVVGAVACGTIEEIITEGGGEGGGGSDIWHYYALVFQGTDNTTINLDGDTTNTVHAGQACETIEGLRNGVFMARVRPGVFGSVAPAN
jgi:prepilin-type N-terminal cleavage/methylation domain-containing protein